jgi:hypothetical protein
MKLLAHVSRSLAEEMEIKRHGTSAPEGSVDNRQLHVLTNRNEYGDAVTRNKRFPTIFRTSKLAGNVFQNFNVF